MTESTLHVPLEEAPTIIPLNVRLLLQRVQSGSVRVPVFQRPLRWKAADVLRLFDSIVRGYPVGSLLFWRKDAEPASQHRIGDVTIAVPGSDDAWWIVDGQQRVTALAAALMDLDQGPDSVWTVRFDPVKRAFLSGPVLPGEEGRVVPLSVLGDLRRLGRWMRGSTLDDEALSVVEETQQRILDYPLSAYLMETSNPDALRGVFARMNSTGVRMRSDEVFQALLGDRSKDGRSLDLNALQAACDLDGFGQPPREEVLKAVLAMSNQDPTRRIEALNDSTLADLVGFEDAAEALGRAVRFLQTDPAGLDAPGAGIPCYAFLPYPVVFVLLAKWFHLFPDSDALIRRSLSLWLWRGVVTATHERAAVSKLRLQVRMIEGDSAESARDALLNLVGEPTRVDWSLQAFSSRSAASRVELLALLSLVPRHRDGDLVSWRALVSDGQRVAREIFPSSHWKKLGKDSRALAKSAANRALLDDRHTGLRAAFLEWDPVVHQGALASHLIDEHLWRKLKEDDAEAFLRLRATRVQTRVGDFLSSRAGLGEPVLRPTEAYLEEAPTEEAS